MRTKASVSFFTRQAYPSRPRLRAVQSLGLGLCLITLGALSSCTISTDRNRDRPEDSAAASSHITAAITTNATPELSAASTKQLEGKVVFLDPGHNGRNDSSISNHVPTGRGGTKECQTTGTSTNNGYPEHTFNWKVIQEIQAQLQAAGAKVMLSRPDDSSVGPCVDQRAQDANAARADAVVSIHGDGAGADQSGFHVSYSAPALNDVQAQQSVTFATAMRDALIESGLAPSNYLGKNGLYGRADLAGLNLAERPSILIELGNMRNNADAQKMESDSGRAQYATAVTAGIIAYLLRTT